MERVGVLVVDWTRFAATNSDNRKMIQRMRRLRSSTKIVFGD